jgi:hypothetical protein
MWLSLSWIFQSGFGSSLLQLYRAVILIIAAGCSHVIVHLFCSNANQILVAHESCFNMAISSLFNVSSYGPEIK